MFEENADESASSTITPDEPISDVENEPHVSEDQSEVCLQVSSLKEEVSSLTDRISYLVNLNNALEAEVLELRALQFQNSFVHEEVLKSHSVITKENHKLLKRVDELQEQVNLLLEEMKDFRPPKAQKKFHDLGPSQQTKVKKDLKDAFTTPADHYASNRDLKLKQLIFEHKDGTKEDVVINAVPHGTFNNLTEVGKKTVQEMGDAKVIGRVSDSSYAALRSISPKLPPLLQVKQYEAEISKILPAFEPAPDRPGVFCSLAEEIITQVEHLIKTANASSQDTIYAVAGCDATKLSNASSVTVYSVAVIVVNGDEVKGRQIGAVGACLGGDSYSDMRLAGKPFFEQLHKLAKTPFVHTSIGLTRIIVKQGGDYSNCLEMYGMMKPTCGNPCVMCIIPKAMFQQVFSHPELLDNCNQGLHNFLE